MSLISLTRLRLRSLRFLPAFLRQSSGAIEQVKRASGFRGGAMLADGAWIYWTMTAWDDEDAMRGYMMTGNHRAVMPYLLNWCDEASVAHWNGIGEAESQREDILPSWRDAERRMREIGRASKVRFPSADHAALKFRPAWVIAVQKLRPMAT